MKLRTMLSMALAAAVALPLAAVPAAAQRYEHNRTTRTVVVKHTEGHRYGRGYGHRSRTVCHNEWRHHHRVRVCRSVRR